LLDVAPSQVAMIVSPGHWLLAEASSSDVLDDMHEFQTKFQAVLPLVAESDD